MKPDEIRKELFNNGEEDFKNFQSKLMPTVDKSKMIGVRTPFLRSFAKKLYKDEDVELFLNDLPHEYFDETNLHSFIIAETKDFDLAVKRVNEILPYVNNWATCDQLCPKCFKKNTEKLKSNIDVWLKSDLCYTVRFGIEMVMNFLLDENFDEKYLKIISEIKSEEYYVNMMIAWFFATALCKQEKKTLPFIEKKTLSPFVQNKTIQKAIESYRISDEMKKYLRTLKV